MLHYTNEIPGGHLVVEKPLAWQNAGLRYTATGYGAKIPTRLMLRIGKRLHRVYLRQYANIGSLFVVYKGEEHFLTSEFLTPGEYVY